MENSASAFPLIECALLKSLIQMSLSETQFTTETEGFQTRTCVRTIIHI